MAEDRDPRGAHDDVRAQYESFPYPARDPADEKRRLHTTILGQLTLVSYVAWGGRRRPGPGFRVMDAGCGTGDSTVFMAELLRGTGAEVVGVDLSQASLDVTRARLEARGLTDVRLVRTRIEDLPAAGLGSFDYIASAGVLHHLPSPERGLEALARLLAPHGAVGIMVYAQYGRTAIYQLQTLLRMLAPPTLSPGERLRRAKELVARLRPDHWAAFARASWEDEVHLNGDAGLYDVLLHSTDRAYTVPELHAWVRGAGLAFQRFLFPLAYRPEMYNDALDYGALPQVERQAAAELLNGRIMKHTFFATLPGGATAPPASDDLAAVPTWLNHDASGGIRAQIAAGKALDVTFEGMRYEQPLAGVAGALLRRVDGRTPLGPILQAVAAETGAGVEQLQGAWRVQHDALAAFNLLGMFPPV